MTRRILLLFVSVLPCGLIAASAFAQTVVIDPGHGGTAEVGGSSPNNATGPKGTLEKTLTLEVALKVKKSLTNQGFTVLLTREKDENLGLAARAKVAKDAMAKVFVSIHFNGDADPKTQGTETYRHKEMAAGSASDKLAKLVQAEVVKATAYRDRGVKTAEFGVLKPANHHLDTAACLVEISFLTDPKDEERLGKDDYKEKLAEAIGVAIFDYLRK